MRTALAIIFSLLMIAGVGVGVYLALQKQNILPKASSPSGIATIAFSPTSGTLNVGQATTVTIAVNFPQQLNISAITVRVKYPYSGTLPEVTAANLQADPNSGFAANDCQIKSITPTAGVVNIDLGCVTTGLVSVNGNVNLASFTLTADTVPVNNPVVLSFDAAESVIGQGQTGTDILLTPTNTASFTVSGTVTQQPSPTPIPPTGVPNACGGTCGSDLNCQSGYTCQGGYCRNSTTCPPPGAPTPTSSVTLATPTPPIRVYQPQTTGELAQSGIVENTLMILGFGLALVTLGGASWLLVK